MKKCSIVLVAMLLAFGASAWAADGAGATKTPRRNAESQPAGKGFRGELGHPVLERLVTELNLTEDQQKQLRQVFQTQQQAVENWRKENGDKVKDLMQQMAAARQAGDTEKAKEIQQQLAPLIESRKALEENLIKQLGDILTPDQLTKAKEIIAKMGQRGGELLDRIHQLNLTDAQKAGIKDIMEKARAAAQQATTPADKAKIIHDAVEQIRTTVLSDEQRKQLGNLGKSPTTGETGGGQFPGLETLGLTDDQKTKIQAIIKDARDQAAKADTPRAKMTILQAARKQIVDNVLTADQKTKWEEWKKVNRPMHRGGPASQPVAPN